MQAFISKPGVATFVGGVICILLGALVLKGQDTGAGLVHLGVFAIGLALKSPGTMVAEHAEKKRASMAPPPGINVPVSIMPGADEDAKPTVPDMPAVKRKP